MSRRWLPWNWGKGKLQVDPRTQVRTEEDQRRLREELLKLEAMAMTSLPPLEEQLEEQEFDEESMMSARRIQESRLGDVSVNEEGDGRVAVARPPVERVGGYTQVPGKGNKKQDAPIKQAAPIEQVAPIEYQPVGGSNPDDVGEVIVVGGDSRELTERVADEINQFGRRSSESALQVESVSAQPKLPKRTKPVKKDELGPDGYVLVSDQVEEREGEPEDFIPDLEEEEESDLEDQTALEELAKRNLQGTAPRPKHKGKGAQHEEIALSELPGAALITEGDSSTLEPLKDTHIEVTDLEERDVPLASSDNIPAPPPMGGKRVSFGELPSGNVSPDVLDTIVEEQGDEVQRDAAQDEEVVEIPDYDASKDANKGLGESQKKHLKELHAYLDKANGAEIYLAVRDSLNEILGLEGKDKLTVQAALVRIAKEKEDLEIKPEGDSPFEREINSIVYCLVSGAGVSRKFDLYDVVLKRANESFGAVDAKTMTKHRRRSSVTPEGDDSKSAAYVPPVINAFSQLSKFQHDTVIAMVFWSKEETFIERGKKANPLELKQGLKTRLEGSLLFYEWIADTISDRLTTEEKQELGVIRRGKVGAKEGSDKLKDLRVKVKELLGNINQRERQKFIEQGGNPREYVEYNQSYFVEIAQGWRDAKETADLLMESLKRQMGQINKAMAFEPNKDALNRGIRAFKIKYNGESIDDKLEAEQLRKSTKEKLDHVKELIGHEGKPGILHHIVFPEDGAKIKRIAVRGKGYIEIDRADIDAVIAVKRKIGEAPLRLGDVMVTFTGTDKIPHKKKLSEIYPFTKDYEPNAKGLKDAAGDCMALCLLTDKPAEYATYNAFLQQVRAAEKDRKAGKKPTLPAGKLGFKGAADLITTLRKKDPDWWKRELAELMDANDEAVLSEIRKHAAPDVGSIKTAKANAATKIDLDKELPGLLDDNAELDAPALVKRIADCRKQMALLIVLPDSHKLRKTSDEMPFYTALDETLYLRYKHHLPILAAKLKALEKGERKGKDASAQTVPQWWSTELLELQKTNGDKFGILEKVKDLNGGKNDEESIGRYKMLPAKDVVYDGIEALTQKWEKIAQAEDRDSVANIEARKKLLASLILLPDVDKGRDDGQDEALYRKIAADLARISEEQQDKDQPDQDKDKWWSVEFGALGEKDDLGILAEVAKIKPAATDFESVRKIKDEASVPGNIDALIAAIKDLADEGKQEEALNKAKELLARLILLPKSDPRYLKGEDKPLYDQYKEYALKLHKYLEGEKAKAGTKGVGQQTDGDQKDKKGKSKWWSPELDALAAAALVNPDGYEAKILGKIKEELGIAEINNDAVAKAKAKPESVLREELPKLVKAKTPQQKVDWYIANMAHLIALPESDPMRGDEGVEGDDEKEYKRIKALLPKAIEDLKEQQRQKDQSTSTEEAQRKKSEQDANRAALLAMAEELSQLRELEAQLLDKIDKKMPGVAALIAELNGEKEKLSKEDQSLLGLEEAMFARHPEAKQQLSNLSLDIAKVIGRMKEHAEDKKKDVTQDDLAKYGREKEEQRDGRHAGIMDTGGQMSSALDEQLASLQAIKKSLGKDEEAKRAAAALLAKAKQQQEDDRRRKALEDAAAAADLLAQQEKDKKTKVEPAKKGWWVPELAALERDSEAESLAKKSNLDAPQNKKHFRIGLGISAEKLISPLLPKDQNLVILRHPRTGDILPIGSSIPSAMRTEKTSAEKRAELPALEKILAKLPSSEELLKEGRLEDLARRRQVEDAVARLQAEMKKIDEQESARKLAQAAFEKAIPSREAEYAKKLATYNAAKTIDNARPLLAEALDLATIRLFLADDARVGGDKSYEALKEKSLALLQAHPELSAELEKQRSSQGQKSKEDATQTDAALRAVALAEENERKRKAAEEEEARRRAAEEEARRRAAEDAAAKLAAQKRERTIIKLREEEKEEEKVRDLTWQEIAVNKMDKEPAYKAFIADGVKMSPVGRKDTPLYGGIKSLVGGDYEPDLSLVSGLRSVVRTPANQKLKDDVSRELAEAEVENRDNGLGESNIAKQAILYRDALAYCLLSDAIEEPEFIKVKGLLDETLDYLITSKATAPRTDDASDQTALDALIAARLAEREAQRDKSPKKYWQVVVAEKLGDKPYKDSLLAKMPGAIAARGILRSEDYDIGDIAATLYQVAVVMDVNLEPEDDQNIGLIEIEINEALAIKLEEEKQLDAQIKAVNTPADEAKKKELQQKMAANLVDQMAHNLLFSGGKKGYEVAEKKLMALLAVSPDLLTAKAPEKRKGTKVALVKGWWEAALNDIDEKGPEYKGYIARAVPELFGDKLDKAVTAIIGEGSHPLDLSLVKKLREAVHPKKAAVDRKFADKKDELKKDAAKEKSLEKKAAKLRNAAVCCLLSGNVEEEEYKRIKGDLDDTLVQIVAQKKAARAEDERTKKPKKGKEKPDSAILDALIKALEKADEDERKRQEDAARRAREEAERKAQEEEGKKWWKPAIIKLKKATFVSDIEAALKSITQNLDLASPIAEFRPRNVMPLKLDTVDDLRAELKAAQDPAKAAELKRKLDILIANHQAAADQSVGDPTAKAQHNLVIAAACLLVDDDSKRYDAAIQEIRFHPREVIFDDPKNPQGIQKPLVIPVLLTKDPKEKKADTDDTKPRSLPRAQLWWQKEIVVLAREVDTDKNPKKTHEKLRAALGNDAVGFLNAFKAQDPTDAAQPLFDPTALSLPINDAIIQIVRNKAADRLVEKRAAADDFLRDKEPEYQDEYRAAKAAFEKEQKKLPTEGIYDLGTADSLEAAKEAAKRLFDATTKLMALHLFVSRSETSGDSLSYFELKKEALGLLRQYPNLPEFVPEAEDKEEEVVYDNVVRPWQIAAVNELKDAPDQQDKELIERALADLINDAEIGRAAKSLVGGREISPPLDQVLAVRKGVLDAKDPSKSAAKEKLEEILLGNKALGGIGIAATALRDANNPLLSTEDKIDQLAIAMAASLLGDPKKDTYNEAKKQLAALREVQKEEAAKKGKGKADKKDDKWFVSALTALEGTNPKHQHRAAIEAKLAFMLNPPANLNPLLRHVENLAVEDGVQPTIAGVRNIRNATSNPGAKELFAKKAMSDAAQDFAAADKQEDKEKKIGLLYFVMAYDLLANPEGVRYNQAMAEVERLQQEIATEKAAKEKKGDVSGWYDGAAADLDGKYKDQKAGIEKALRTLMSNPALQRNTKILAGDDVSANLAGALAVRHKPIDDTDAAKKLAKAELQRVSTEWAKDPYDKAANEARTAVGRDKKEALQDEINNLEMAMACYLLGDPNKALYDASMLKLLAAQAELKAIKDAEAAEKDKKAKATAAPGWYDKAAADLDGKYKDQKAGIEEALKHFISGAKPLIKTFAGDGVPEDLVGALAIRHAPIKDDEAAKIAAKKRLQSNLSDAKGIYVPQAEAAGRNSGGIGKKEALKNEIQSLEMLMACCLLGDEKADLYDASMAKLLAAQLALSEIEKADATAAKKKGDVPGWYDQAVIDLRTKDDGKYAKGVDRAVGQLLQDSQLNPHAKKLAGDGVPTNLDGALAIRRAPVDVTKAAAKKGMEDTSSAWAQEYIKRIERSKELIAATKDDKEKISQLLSQVASLEFLTACYFLADPDAKRYDAALGQLKLAQTALESAQAKQAKAKAPSGWWMDASRDTSFGKAELDHIEAAMRAILSTAKKGYKLPERQDALDNIDNIRDDTDLFPALNGAVVRNIALLNEEIARLTDPRAKAGHLLTIMAYRLLTDEDSSLFDDVKARRDKLLLDADKKAPPRRPLLKTEEELEEEKRKLKSPFDEEEEDEFDKKPPFSKKAERHPKVPVTQSPFKSTGGGAYGGIHPAGSQYRSASSVVAGSAHPVTLQSGPTQLPVYVPYTVAAGSKAAEGAKDVMRIMYKINKGQDVDSRAIETCKSWMRAHGESRTLQECDRGETLRRYVYSVAKTIGTTSDIFSKMSEGRAGEIKFDVGVSPEDCASALKLAINPKSQFTATQAGGLKGGKYTGNQ